MDKLSRFAVDGEVSLTSKTLDNITDGLNNVTNGVEDVLLQLEATHTGHEEELWGKDIEVEKREDLDIEED